MDLCKYMVVISFDAVSSKDLDVLMKFPNFKRIIDGGALVKDVKSVYPSLTYPAHATIVTGKYPRNHGVVDNTLFKINDESPDWHWYRKYVKGKTLYDLVEEKGLKSCSLFWPVTARSSITYNMPEIFCTKPYHNQLLMSALAGNLTYQLEINKMFSYIRKGIKEPELDDFTTEAVKHTIKKYKPNLILVHLIDVDSHRHNFGYKDIRSIDALERHDRRLGEILEALEEAEILEDSTIVALGDHSTIDVSKLVRLNKLFLDNGLIEVDSKNKIKDYKAIVKSLDGSSYVYLKEKKDLVTRKKVEKLLRENISKENPIEQIFDEKEIKEMGASKEATFMVEAKKGYYFVDEYKGEIIESVNEEDVGKKSHRYKATHGYSPMKDQYGTFFIGYGRGFKKGFIKNGGKLINHGPTLAKVLGINMDNCDGSVDWELLSGIK